MTILRRRLLAFACPALLAAAPATTAPGDEVVYRERLATFLRDAGNFPYSPMESMPGTKSYRPLPPVDSAHHAIAADALDAARTYAAANRSSALIVWHAGRIETAWYGPGIGPDTPLVSKSLSKPLTAIAVGRAIQLGKLKSLDVTLAELMPELTDNPRGAIRVRYLLDMRSGMLDQGFSPDPEHPLNRGFLDPHHDQRILSGYPMIAAPGTRYSYANAPSDLIARVIEKATGRRYAEFVGNEVLARIGARAGTIWVNRPGGVAHSGCCTYMPAENYLRLAVLLAQDGRWGGKPLLPKGYVAEMRRGTAQNPNFGLGLWIGEPYRQRRGFGAPGTLGPQILQSEPFLDPDLYMFDGNASQTVHISPRNNLIVLRMGATPPVAPEWDNAILPNTLIRGLAKR